TMSRDVRRCLPRRSGLSAMAESASISTPSDERDDFELVAVVQLALGVPRSRDEFEIAFDGQIPRLHFELFEQPGDGRPRRTLARLAVDADLHRYFLSSSDPDATRDRVT